jgi:hypothetical protein
VGEGELVTTIRIEPVGTAGQQRAFVRLPYVLNAGRPLWVPPLVRDQRHELDRRRNPFYRHATAEFFLAYRGTEPVGRIAAIQNPRHNAHWHDRVGFFGYYEAIEDADVSRRLFDAAEQWLRAHGSDRLRGPTNPVMNASAGFLIEGFEYPPAIPMPHTPPYYTAQAEAGGLSPTMDLLVYGWDYRRLSQRDHIDPRYRRIQRLSQYVRERKGVRVRQVDARRVAEELQAIKTICNTSLTDNWGFVPITDDDMQAWRHELQQIIDPEMFFLAEIDGQPEAVFLACPDYNEVLARMGGRIWPWGWWTFLRYRRRISKYVVYVYAATPRAEGLGAAAALYEAYFGSCFRKGIHCCETGYVLEDNTLMRNSIEELGAAVRKRYRMYEKPL